ncbi:cytochrome ubiquinol oxidase subunit I [Desulfogranum japonicum]|uniref:cytochrome ubiquinol oxidase subunit I n=1 Tax=Desulfogranum japonicum TaxID=231447 RepID=UPI00041F4CC3|nr:cytochrome ubiquinol oxidase subunit I [Desulfogranum japonicum]
MDFPLLHIPILGDGMTIAVDAVLHVLISHGVAIGVVSLLVVFQAIHGFGGSTFWKTAAQGLLMPVVVVTTSVGAVTGVGIWFITGVLAPNGIGSLIHLFFWPWFIEWCVFIIEVIILLYYYRVWDRWAEQRPKSLTGLGLLYIMAAVISAILISGILGFMLTPDGWPQGQSFSQAYFNPTFVPQFLLRIAAGVAMGAILVLGWLAWKCPVAPEERGKLLRMTGVILFLSGSCSGICLYFYLQKIPQTFLTHWKFALATSAFSQRPDILYIVQATFFAILVLTAIAALLKLRKTSMVLFLPAFLTCVLLVAEFERVREFVRGPYLLPGYMYANQISMVHSLESSQNGLLKDMKWSAVHQTVAPHASSGQALFATNCGVCHTMGGINDIRTRLRGRTLEGVSAIISITSSMVPFMAPFSGTEQERLQLAEYLYYQTNVNAQPQPQLLSRGEN